MSHTAATTLLLIAGAYLLAGGICSIWFLSVGIVRMDSAARGSSIGFRILLLPSAVVLWPVVIGLWLTSRRTTEASP